MAGVGWEGVAGVSSKERQGFGCREQVGAAREWQGFRGGGVAVNSEQAKRGHGVKSKARFLSQ